MEASPLDTLPDPNLSDNAVTVLKRRYLQKDADGRVIESPKEMFLRVASVIASNERRYRPDVDLLEETKRFYRMMASLDFIPNSPTMMNAGRPLGQLAACFVLPVSDTMEGIFESIKQAALVHKSGGGTGFSFSRLRPKSSMVASTTGTASGPVSFMAVFNAATEAIKQGGTRRGANMGILRVDHPDIREFITCKKDMVSITNFNISVTATDRFMEALEQGTTYDLIAPHTGKIVGTESAREIFDMIAENSWLNGDPGLVFIDEVNRHEKTPHVGLVEATNPCGEQPLLPYESCNLGSVNLNNMLKESLAGLEIDYDHLRRVVRRGVRFLDNIIDQNKYPIPEIHEMTHNNRRIGLGVMGFADMLYALRIPYDSGEALDLGRDLMQFIHTEARKMSDELAVERGAFPNCEGSVFDHPTRNSTVTTIAPTGTISMIADCSGGIEPNFALCYVKRVMDDDRLLYVNPRLEEAARSGNWYSPELMKKIADGAHLEDLAEIPEDIRRVFVTAHEITPEWHIRMQAAFQEWTDNAVSKTINFPHEATVEDVKSAYLLAWKLNCKGITIYRDGSRPVQVMNVGDKLAKKTEEAALETAPTEAARPQAVEPAILPRRPAAAYPTLKPRNRPRITHGYTEQIKTGEGTLYVTINEDDVGLCEVFASIGKVGGSAMAQSEAIGRLISLSLRSGVDPRAIVYQLKGITGPNSAWHEGELIRSIPDAIARALERYLDRKEKIQAELPLGAVETLPAGAVAELPPMPSPKPELRIQYAVGFETKELCPDCNGPISFEEGCLICRS
ncbi:MAG: vitamin B12-dependent ribonucleotide reductase, partial [Calditrichaeota bacterium]|nr:vitamin B12-dependent ribonucleotide reductase [Calditrichota bacterium]